MKMQAEVSAGRRCGGAGISQKMVENRHVLKRMFDGRGGKKPVDTKYSVYRFGTPQDVILLWKT
jgi:hypothetical protein